MFYTANFKGYHLPPAPPASAPLISPFKNFNIPTFIIYYIKKTAENFTLNRVLLMLNISINGFVLVKMFSSICRVRYYYVRH